MRVALKDIGIPPRPSILARVDAEIAEESPDFIKLAALIGADVGLSAGFIKTANSPFFGFGKKVRTIQEALLVLGLKLVATTVAGLSLQQAFKHLPHMERFWDASATTARVAGWLARRLRKHLHVRPEDAYTFALFRDCGIPVLMSPFPDYVQILAEANTAPVLSFTEIEDQRMAINHALVGAELVESWSLPTDIVVALRHHHDRAYLMAHIDTPTLDQPTAYIALAHLAEHLIQSATQKTQTVEWDKMGEACLAALQISNDELMVLRADCKDFLDNDSLL